MRPFGLRTRLTLAVAGVALVALAGLTVGFNAVLDSSLSGDAGDVLRARAAAAIDTISESPQGHLMLKETPDQGTAEVPIWVYDGTRSVERPIAPASQQSLADSLAGANGTFAEDPATDMRMYATRVLGSGRTVGTVVSALSLAPYERTEARALVFSLVFSALVLILFVAAMRWATGRALRPVARMTSEALTWSERDLDHRFNAGAPHDEITRLAAAFDRMLDRLAASLRHEQLFTAEVSHELRTPLAAILAESEFALRRERGHEDYRRALESIVNRAHQLQRTTETLLLAARAESQPIRGTVGAMGVAERALDLHREEAEARNVSLAAVAPPAPLRVGADGEIVERVISPLLENACRHARGQVEIRIDADPHSVSFMVVDDGPGAPEAERADLFEPGYRGSAAQSAAHGAGLGLSLARRLARSVDGEVEHRAEPTGAECFVARFPRA